MFVVYPGTSAEVANSVPMPDGGRIVLRHWSDTRPDCFLLGVECRQFFASVVVGTDQLAVCDARGKIVSKHGFCCLPAES